MGLRPSRMMMPDDHGEDGEVEEDEWFHAIKLADTVSIKRLMVMHDIDQVDDDGELESKNFFDLQFFTFFCDFLSMKIADGSLIFRKIKFSENKEMTF